MNVNGPFEMCIFLVAVQVIQSQEGDFRLHGLGGFGSAQLLIRRVSETLGLKHEG